MVKCLSIMRETWVRSLGREDPLEKEMAIHSSTIGLEKSHGQRSLVGYSPWGRKESDTIEQLHFHFGKNSIIHSVTITCPRAMPSRSIPLDTDATLSLLPQL